MQYHRKNALNTAEIVTVTILMTVCDNNRDITGIPTINTASIPPCPAPNKNQTANLVVS